jgi:uncharacterized protein YutD
MFFEVMFFECSGREEKMDSEISGLSMYISEYPLWRAVGFSIKYLDLQAHGLFKSAEWKHIAQYYCEVGKEAACINHTARKQNSI